MKYIEPMERRYLMAAITGFTLINADTDEVIQSLSQDSVINLAAMPTRNLNIRAEATGDTRKVNFALNDDFFHTENVVPYALVSNDGSDYHAWTPEQGKYELEATAYSSRYTWRTRSNSSSTLRFEVIDVATTPAPTSPAPTTPIPSAPAPTTPVPTRPEPTNPAPTTPAPTAPAPTTPAPTAPTTPTAPAPTTPAPTTPAPTAPAPTTPGAPKAPQIEGNWELSFQEDFNGTSVSNKWTSQYWWWNGDTGDNGEMQVYTKDSLSVKDGVLNVTATKANTTAKFNGQTYNYKSGLLTTGGSENGQAVGYEFTYGYAEARIKIPAGQGLWSAFWMLPTSRDDGAGEIDIMEILGNDPDTLETHYHVDGAGDIGKASAVVDLSQDFHVYAVDWQPNSITWYLDGKKVFSTTTKVVNEPMYLMLNLAVGGDWPGAPNSSTKFPSSMQVDYVNVWQKAN